METRLDNDVLEKIVRHLDDPSDIVRVSCVSREWQDFVIKYGLAKHLCLRMFPQLSRVDHVVEPASMAESLVAVGPSNMEWETLKKEHRAYAFLAQGFMSFPEKEMVMVRYTASYENPVFPIVLTYKLVDDICVVTEIRKKVLRGPAHFQSQWGMDSAKSIQFRMGHLNSFNDDNPLHKNPGAWVPSNPGAWVPSNPRLGSSNQLGSMEPNPGFRRTQAWVQRNPSVGSSNQLGSMELDPGFRRTQAWVQRNPGVGSKNPERLGSSNQLGSMELDPGFEEPSTPGFEEPSTPGCWVCLLKEEDDGLGSSNQLGSMEPDPRFKEPSMPGFEMMMMNIYIFSVGLMFDDDEESKARKRKEKKRALFGFDSTQVLGLFGAGFVCSRKKMMANS
ncbi:hypothetical protein SLEP1_g24126 [Rubroshorea leprosula]|uniref:F-box domain-containing protein n=1 Tax=Rubroshorea leprosula TaxID=152421 RepID=A0AAV5JNA8_9ROSI|nr:hypothetical protein SLEP1_g24126 [Rubroshorea leprosula]